jgi:uncharacterized protein (TIGR02679 family)
MSLDPFRGSRYAKLLDRSRRHLEGRDRRVGGSFTVKDLTEVELRDINGLLGTDRGRGKNRISVDAAGLDATLRSGYGIGLVELLETIGPALRSKSEEEARRARLRDRITAPARASPLHTDRAWYRDWLAWAEGAGGTVTRLVTNGDIDTLARAVHVLETVDAHDPDASPLLLPWLAVDATGDTKALDRRSGTLPTLVLRALARRSGMDPGDSAEERRALWEDNDVVQDDLASRVLVLNLSARGDGLGEWLTDAAARAIPLHVTLHQLVRLPVTVYEPVVYVCENPAVLRQAAEDLGAHSMPLLCTEGWPSAAFHRLAAAVREGGGRLLYHGDFDWPGVTMTARMVSRHGATPWRMSASDYVAHEGRERHELKGNPSSTPWDPPLEAAMVERGHAVFEESVKDGLLTDLRRR